MSKHQVSEARLQDIQVKKKVYGKSAWFACSHMTLNGKKTYVTVMLL